MHRCVFLILLLCAGMAFSEPARILVAYESTEFKKTLVDEMAALLKKDSAAVTVIEHAKGGLDSLDAAAFDAVFITNSGVNSKVRPWIMAWLAKSEKSRNRILLHTTQIRSWKVEAPVDAVTSASARKNVPALAKEYAGLLKKRIADSQKARSNAAE